MVMMLVNINRNNAQEIVFSLSLLVLQFKRYLNTPWSIVNEEIGTISWTKVVTRSTAPYSSVDSRAVYKGNRKKDIN